LTLIGIALRSALSEWEAREALERKYTMLMEHITEGVLLVRIPNGQIIAANPAAARLTGHAIEDLQRLDLGALFPFDSPTDWLREVRILGQTSMTAVALRRKYGTTATVEVDAAFLRQGREKVVQMVFRPAAATPSSDAGTVPAMGALASPFSLTSSSRHPHAPLSPRRFRRQPFRPRPDEERLPLYSARSQRRSLNTLASR
jgi:PAS domain S-box-containing protein